MSPQPNPKFASDRVQRSSGLAGQEGNLYVVLIDAHFAELTEHVQSTFRARSEHVTEHVTVHVRFLWQFQHLYIQ